MNLMKKQALMNLPLLLSKGFIIGFIFRGMIKTEAVRRIKNTDLI